MVVVYYEENGGAPTCHVSAADGQLMAETVAAVEILKHHGNLVQVAWEQRNKDVPWEAGSRMPESEKGQLEAGDLSITFGHNDVVLVVAFDEQGFGSLASLAKHANPGQLWGGAVALDEMARYRLRGALVEREKQIASEAAAPGAKPRIHRPRMHD